MMVRSQYGLGLLGGLGLLVLFFLAAPVASAETVLEVIHKNTLWPDGNGVLKITGEAIEFEAEDKEHSRRWVYRDIRFLDRVSPSEIILLTYGDAQWQLGRDKRYRFLITSGEFTEPEFNRISAKMGKPVANRTFDVPSERRYEVAVKHSHRFGGCEGRLLFTENRIFYEAGNQRHSREWLVGRDVQSVWSADPYQFEMHVYEGGRRRFSKTQIFSFDLKQELDQGLYRQLKTRLYNAGKTKVPRNATGRIH
jgi:hypothetical protein